MTCASPCAAQLQGTQLYAVFDISWGHNKIVCFFQESFAFYYIRWAWHYSGWMLKYTIGLGPGNDRSSAAW